MAKRPKTTGNPNIYSELANMVSISMVIRCDSFSMLALVDSFPQEIYQSLIERGYSKEKKLKVDYVKMPHHGSAENISNNLLDIIDITLLTLVALLETLEALVALSLFFLSSI